MNFSTRCLAAALITGLLHLPQAQASDWRTEVDLQRADLSVFEMDLINEGVQAGSMRYGWERDGDHYVVRDRTRMDPDVLETAEARIDASTLLSSMVEINYSEGERK